MLFVGHYDTVFGADHPFQHVHQDGEDTLRGPGVADLKGGLIAMRHALEVLEERRVLTDGPAPVGVDILINPDEEIGSPSSKQALAVAAGRAEVGLVYEPALPDGSLVSGRKGSGNYTLVVRGRLPTPDGSPIWVATPSSPCRRRRPGHRRTRRRRPGATVNVGTIRGGTSNNIVPALAVVDVNIRITERDHADWFDDRSAASPTRVGAAEGLRRRSTAASVGFPKAGDSRRWTSCSAGSPTPGRFLGADLGLAGHRRLLGRERPGRGRVGQRRHHGGSRRRHPLRWRVDENLQPGRTGRPDGAGRVRSGGTPAGRHLVTVLRPVERADIPALQAHGRAKQRAADRYVQPRARPRVRRSPGRRIASPRSPSEPETPGEESYLFVLDHQGDVWGMSGIIAAVGLTEPFWSYRVGSLVNSSRELGIYKSHPILFLTNDYTGTAELCSLFLDPSHRGANAGRLLSLGRMLFLAEHPDRFAERVIAEMRGVIDENGRSPLWRGLGIHFFDLPFGEADDIFGRGNKQFIAELMPQHPVYIDLLPKKAQAVIGQVHERTRPALRMLESEGLRYEGYVDIFDGGPTVAAPVDALRTVAESVECTVDGRAPLGGRTRTRSGSWWARVGSRATAASPSRVPSRIRTIP